MFEFESFIIIKDCTVKKPAETTGYRALWLESITRMLSLVLSTNLF
jgi:hypothetical protein